VNAQPQNPVRAPAPTLDELCDGYLRSSSRDSHDGLEALFAERPGWVAAHLLRIAKVVVAKDLQAFPALERALGAVRPHLLAASEQERRHVAAAEAWLAHRPLHAAYSYSTLSANDPHDLLALRLAQSCWFFLGRRAQVHAVAERALRAWSPRERGYDIALAMLAFGCDEIGDATRAETLASQALDIEPHNPYAIHALAHALGARHPPATVVRFLKDSAPRWRVGGRLDSHIAWHCAVAQLEIGDVAAAVAVLRGVLSPLAADGPSAASDATDLAWRLELAGVDVRSTWERLADAWARHAPGFWPPYDLLAGIAYFRADSAEQAAALRRRLAQGPYLRPCVLRAARKITLPALTAIEAFSQGAFAAAESHLHATIHGMAGSLLQRELFELTLRAARRSRVPYATPPAALRIPA
jgi:tetratricopeptide (TPR) repeat protein